MKKIISAFLAVVLMFSFVACSNNTSSNNATNSESTATNNQTSSENSTNTATKKTLVAYFSGSGNTKHVAEMIAENTGADLFEITPADPYTDDDLNYTNDNSRVSVEHNDESKRDVPLTKTTPDNWSDYDTVFIGYPIWWGIAAWPVNNFVKDNDFSGKTVIPFCTSSSSGLGQSGDLLAEMADTGNWQDGERFSSNSSESDIKDWVNSLD